jgi:hypothetical protein
VIPSPGFLFSQRGWRRLPMPSLRRKYLHRKRIFFRECHLFLKGSEAKFKVPDLGIKSTLAYRVKVDSGI